MKRIQLTFLGLLAVNILVVSYILWIYQGEGGITKSPNDPREYRLTHLPNHLTALLISDPEADMAAASLNVQAGQFHDPKNLPGLAHFLEHMLFLGTDQYPDADEFGNYLSTKGGQSNAFTAYENTNFHFQIPKDHLDGALARFSRFFIAPKFDAQFVGREVQAVDSEHQKNFNDDYRRFYEVQKTTANPEHPYSRFGTGSLKTLIDGRNETALRKDLIRFYTEHYSAERMFLVVVGSEDLDRLEAMVWTHFQEVPNRNLGPYQSQVAPLRTTPGPQLIQLEPIKDLRSLTLSYTIPAQEKLYESKPDELLTHLLGHEGKGSLLSYFKSQGWALSLSAGAHDLDQNHGQLTINIQLTPTGVAHWPEMLQAVNQYIALIQQADLAPYFQELKTMGEINFRFSEQSDPMSQAIQLAEVLPKVQSQDLLESRYLHRNFDAEQVLAILAQLKPENLTVTLMAKGAKTNRMEPYYQTPYALEPLQMPVASAPIPELQLPELNPFLPSEVDLAEVSATPAPTQLLDTEGLTLWHQPDPQFGVPKVGLYALISNPAGYASPKQAALSQIFLMMLKDQLNEISYPASLAGLNYELSLDTKGIELNLHGYNQGLPKLMEAIAAAWTHPQLDEQRFTRYQQALIQDRTNRLQGPAYHQAGYELQALMTQPIWHHREYVAAAKSITLQDLQTHAKALTGAGHMLAFAYGNLDAAEAKTLATQLQQSLQLKPLDKQSLTRSQVLLLPQQPPLRYIVPVADVNSSVALYFQHQPESPQASAEIGLLAQFLEKPLYHQLRTVEQLGYVVFSQQQNIHGVEGLMILVQSGNRSPQALQERIQAALAQFRAELQAMPEAELEEFKKAQAEQLNKQSRNQMEEMQRFWSDLTHQRPFDHRALEAKALANITKAQLLALYDQVLLQQPKLAAAQAWSKNHSGMPKPVELASLKAKQTFYAKP